MRSSTAAAAVVAAVLCVAAPSLGASLSTLHSREHNQARTIHRDRGTIRFFANHPWLLHHGATRRRMVAHRAVVFARAELAWTLRELAETKAALRPPPVAVGGWAATVACENSGRWQDSPGRFYLGLQFDPGSWRTAASHTGRWGTSPADQVVNATWLAEHSAADPWPNCPDPFFG